MWDFNDRISGDGLVCVCVFSMIAAGVASATVRLAAAKQQSGKDPFEPSLEQLLNSFPRVR